MSAIEEYKKNKLNPLFENILKCSDDFLSYSGYDIRSDDIDSNDFNSPEDDFYNQFVDKIKPIINTFIDNYALRINDNLFDSQALIEETQSALINIINEHFSQTYVCTRVWSAWSYGTMTEEDFTAVSEDSYLVNDLLTSVMDTYSDLQAFSEKQNIAHSVAVEQANTQNILRL